MRVYGEDVNEPVEDKVFRGHHVNTISSPEGTRTLSSAQMKCEVSSEDSEESEKECFSSDRSSLSSRLDDLRHARSVRIEKALKGREGCS
jgi:hypothetical protein